jgi:hypothetical protein
MPVIDRDLGYGDFMTRLAGMHSVSVLVGVDGTGTEVEVGEGGKVIATPDLAQIALWNEFGTEDGHVPERSFLRSTMDENRAKYLNLQQVAVDRMLDGLAPRTAYGAIGLVACADVRRKIRNRVDPANAESTIRQKDSDVPLVDTGELYDAIGYQIEQLT